MRRVRSGGPQRDLKTGRFLKSDGFLWSRHPLYAGYLDMMARCYNHNNPQYADYGGRGIKVCERWQSFENFVADVGERPPGRQLDRIDNFGDYTPENWRWATRSQQQRNRRNNNLLTFRGKTQTVIAWSLELGINHSTLYKRINCSGWSAEDALATAILSHSDRVRRRWQKRESL